MKRGANPFPGPRPLTEQHQIFGRDREIRELRYLLTAERIVLLHSPSGAGKTSLLHAKGGLISELREQFEIWGPARAGSQPPVGTGNRFSWSVADGWRRPDPPEPGVDLARYAARYVKGCTLVVFDQFEELLRIDPHRHEEKRRFMEQLGEMLTDPRFWALFVMREEYLAQLFPYRTLIPTHLRHRYRISFLERAKARGFAERAMWNGGLEMKPEASERLIDDLSRIGIQRPDGTLISEFSPEVEPLHLQVSCLRLWDRIPAGRKEITADDVRNHGGVDQALTDYYSSRIRMFAQAGTMGMAGTWASTDAGLDPKEGELDEGLREFNREAPGDPSLTARAERHEGAIRDWIEYTLVSPEGLRMAVRKGSKEWKAMPARVLSWLEDAHLIRPEQRAGHVWYELSHDRLVGPVRADNERWWSTRVSLDRAARRWDRNGRNPLFLYQGEALAQLRAAIPDEPLDPVPSAFVAACEEAEVVRQRGQRRDRRLARTEMLLGVTLAAGLPFFLQGVFNIIEELTEREEWFTLISSRLLGSAFCIGIWQGIRWYGRRYRQSSEFIFILTRKLAADKSLQTASGPSSNSSQKQRGFRAWLDAEELTTLRMVPFWGCLLAAGADGRFTRGEMRRFIRGLDRAAGQLATEPGLRDMGKAFAKEKELLLAEFANDRRSALEGIKSASGILQALDTRLASPYLLAMCDVIKGTVGSGTRWTWRPPPDMSAAIFATLLLSGESPAAPQPQRIYVHSGIFTIGGLGAATLVGSLAAVAAGWMIPNADDRWVHAVAFFISAFFTGALAGATTRIALEKTKTRSPAFMRLAGLVTAVIGLVAAAATGTAPAGNFQTGITALGAVIFAITVFVTATGAIGETFCEGCGTWCHRQKGSRTFSPAGAEAEATILGCFSSGDTAGAIGMIPGPNAPLDRARILRIDTFLCPGCGEFAAISLVRIVTDGGKQRSETLLDRLLVSASSVKALRSNTS